jgi:MFS family permease
VSGCAKVLSNVNVRNVNGDGRRLGVAADHPSYKWWALSCTSLGMLLATINSGTLIIALPDLERSLHTSLLQLVWVILAYMIASTVLVLTAGRLSDLFGRKKAYVGAFVVFSAASLGAGFAGNGTELILWRILQGIAGAFIFAHAPALVTDAFPRERRPGCDLLALGLLVQRPARPARRRLGGAGPARARKAGSEPRL